MIYRLDHLVLTVANIDTTIAFYRDGLGMTPVSLGNGRHALTFGRSKINLHQKGQEFEPKAQAPTAGSADLCFIADCSLPEVMEHCHMPLQGGHDDLLRRMKRLYTTASFLEIVKELREAMPNIGLTTDIIVGFPGETEEEFEGTLTMIEKVRFDGAYMFKYSPRPGTPAAEMEQVPKALSEERLARLMAVQDRIGLERNQEQIGRTFELLIDSVSSKTSGTVQGYTRCFRLMHVPGDKSLVGQLVHARATEAHRWGLIGERVA